MAGFGWDPVVGAQGFSSEQPSSTHCTVATESIEARALETGVKTGIGLLAWGRRYFQDGHSDAEGTNARYRLYTISLFLLNSH